MIAITDLNGWFVNNVRVDIIGILGVKKGMRVSILVQGNKRSYLIGK